MTDMKWLALTQEDTIDPGLRICDPHHHLWGVSDYRPERYLLEDLMPDLHSGHNIVKTVYIECRSSYRPYGPKKMQPVGEMEFIRGIANRALAERANKTEVAAGVVAFADLTLGEAVEPVLEALTETGQDHLRGIRHISVWDPDPVIATPLSPGKGLLFTAKFREGFACLKKFGLSFDAWLYFHQMLDLADLAKTFPDTTIVMNHIGGIIRTGPYAGKDDEVLNEWKRGIDALAACSNVVVKLGGLGMPRSGFGWETRPTPPTSIELAEATSPFFMYCIDQFGVARCMFESNFPVDKLSSSYNVLWNSFKRVAQGFTAKEKAALFYDTASRVYRLS